jgi:hypothetical protein
VLGSGFYLAALDMPAGHFENGKGFRPQALSFNATNGERPVFAFRYDETSMAPFQ